jgi:hypothetical protein
MAIEGFIQGEPVSRAISGKLTISAGNDPKHHGGPGASGFLSQPHTLAGRVRRKRTALCRFDPAYYELSGREQEQIRSKYENYPAEATDRLETESFVFLSLPGCRLLLDEPGCSSAYRVCQAEEASHPCHFGRYDGSVQNRFIGPRFFQSELDHLSDYMNGFLTGLTLFQERKTVRPDEARKVLISPARTGAVWEKAFLRQMRPMFLSRRTTFFGNLSFRYFKNDRTLQSLRRKGNPREAPG